MSKEKPHLVHLTIYSFDDDVTHMSFLTERYNTAITMKKRLEYGEEFHSLGYLEARIEKFEGRLTPTLEEKYMNSHKDVLNIDRNMLENYKVFPTKKILV